MFEIQRSLKIVAVAGLMSLSAVMPASALTTPEVQALISERIDELEIQREALRAQLDAGGLAPPTVILLQEEIQRLGARISQGGAVVPLIPFLGPDAIGNILEFFGIDASPA